MTAPGDGSAGRTRRSLLRQERSKETRRTLIRTAARLWSEQGFDAVTVEEICTAAGVGRTTFYLYFASRDQLLASLAGGTATGVEEDIDALGLDASIEDRIEAFIVGLTRRMDAVPKPLVELVIHSYRTHVRTERSGRRFADILGELLAAARERGELVEGADAAELGEILGALAMDAIEGWAARADGPALETVLRFRFELVLDRFRAPRRP